MGGEIERVRIWFENLGALAVLLMWFRQLRTLTIISSQMAVLWHMMVSMLGDVVSFLQMLVVVLLGFTGVLAMVFWEDVVPLAVNGECDGLIGDGTTWWSISKKLFEGSMLGDAPFLECIELSNHYWTGLVLTYTFTVIVVVLLLNMIMGMMGKTFDNYYDGATKEAAANFARIVQDWESRDALPAPFNLFTVPAHVLVFALSKGKVMFGGCFEWLIDCWNWMINCWNKRYANLPETKTDNDEDESNKGDKTL